MTAPADLQEQEEKICYSLPGHGEISLSVSSARIQSESMSTLPTSKRGQMLVNISLLLSSSETEDSPSSV
jgi:hypothetical protein